jgi:hypothetical protein
MTRGIVDVAGSRLYSIATPGMAEYLRRSGALDGAPTERP